MTAPAPGILGAFVSLGHFHGGVRLLRPSSSLRSKRSPRLDTDLSDRCPVPWNL